MGLWRYILRRLLLAVVVLFMVSIATFALAHAIPGDPVTSIISERQANNPEVRATVERHWGLDRPVPLQYAYFVAHLMRGDLGESFTNRRPVTEDLRRYVPATFELSMAAMLYAVVVGGPLGVVAALSPGRWPDHVSRFIALLGASMPVFWLGLLVSYLFFYRLNWFPRQGQLDIGMAYPERVTGLVTVDALLAGDGEAFRSVLLHLVMPAFVLGSFVMGIIARMLRSSLVAALADDYIRTARAKGLIERRVIVSHAMRNALIPTITVFGLTFASLLAGAVLTETIFDWPGVGQYAVETALNRDYPGLLGVTFIIAIGYIVVNLAVDVAYGLLDPRIRVG